MRLPCNCSVWRKKNLTELLQSGLLKRKAATAFNDEEDDPPSRNTESEPSLEVANEPEREENNAEEITHDDNETSRLPSGLLEEEEMHADAPN